MNYFAFFDLPVSFYPDKEKVRTQYLQNSRKYHPDIYQGDEEDQAMVLTALNNKAYSTLQDPAKTQAYILNELYPEEKKASLPPAFLGEMMETNEALMEAKMEEDQEALNKAKEEVEERKRAIEQDMEVYMQSFTENNLEGLEPIRTSFLKLNYLKRLLDQL